METQLGVPAPVYTALTGLWPISPVLGSDVGHDVLIEELEDQRDAVGKHQVLGHVFKLKPTQENKQPCSLWSRGKSHGGMGSC